MSSNILYEISTFTPIIISGCALWLDANDSSTLSLSGSSVLQWNDKSGNGLNVSKNASYSAPTYSATGLNSRPTLTFSTSMLQTASINPNTTLTRNGTDSSLFFVVTITSDGAGVYGTLYGISITDDHYILRTPWADSSKYWDCADRVQYIATTNGTYIFSLVRSGSSMTMYMNGTSVASNLSASSTVTSTSQNLNIGVGLFSRAEWFRSALSEFIIYKTGTDTNQRQAVEGYLAQKWGLTGSLPANHPYKTAAVYATYNLPPTLRATLPTNMAPSSSSFSFLNPVSLGGCQLWLDGADPNGNGSLPTNGSSVTTWVDKSGVGNNGVSGGTSVPTFSNKSIVLNGSGYYETNYSAAPTNESFFIVYKCTTIASDTFLIQGYQLNQRLYYISPSLSRWPYLGKIGVWGTYSSNPLSSGVTYLSEFIWNGTSLSASLYLNGSAQSQTNISTFSGFSGTPITSQIGGSINGNIYEIIGFNVPLPTSQRQQIEGYLAWKWSLLGSLPSTHPYKNSPPGLSIPVVPQTRQLGNRIFQPTNFSGCVLWLDGADMTTMFQNAGATTPVTANNQGIYIWKDKTTSAISVNFGNTNVYQTSNGPYFPGNQGEYLIPLTVCAIFAVATYYTTSYANDFPGILGAQLATGNLLYGFQSTVGSSLPTSTGYYNGGSGISSPNIKNIYSSVAVTPTTYTGLRVGYGDLGAATGGKWNGSISEILVYNTRLSTNQRQTVEGYLAWKWALQAKLPNNHPYKKIPPPP